MPKRLVEFLEVPNANRMNPQSIRRMIFDYVVRYFGADCDAASIELNSRRVLHKGRSYRNGISKDHIYRITRDEGNLLYLLLEAIAIERRVPVSLLLFYTRLTADLAEENGRAKAAALVQGFSGVLVDAQDKLQRRKPITFDDLAHWIDEFTALSPPSNSMPPTNPQADPDAAKSVTQMPDPDEPTFPGMDLPVQLVSNRSLSAVESEPLIKPYKSGG